MYRGRLVDNGKFVCGIELATKWGSRLPWNCLPGFKAWSTPDGGQVVYSTPSHKDLKLGDIRKTWQGDPGTHDNQYTVLRGKWFGCQTEDPYKPTPMGRRSSFWKRRSEDAKGEDFEEDIVT